MSDSTSHPLTALETFLVSRRNPSLTLQGVRDGFASETFCLQGAGLVLANPDGLVESWLVPWAAREALSLTSAFATLPAALPDWWLGTGRHQAADQGGWYHWLAGRVNEWTELVQEGQRPWRRAAYLGLLDRAQVVEWLGQFAPRDLLPGLQYWPTRLALRCTHDSSWVRSGDWVGVTVQDVLDNASKSVVLAQVRATLQADGLDLGCHPGNCSSVECGSCPYQGKSYLVKECED